MNIGSMDSPIQLMTEIHQILEGLTIFEIDKTNFTLDISGTKSSPTAKITSDSITFENTL